MSEANSLVSKTFILNTFKEVGHDQHHVYYNIVYKKDAWSTLDL